MDGKTRGPCRKLPALGNVYYEPGRDRAARVNALFTRIAARYDLINDLQSFGLHRRWKRRVVRLARGGSGQRALDVCCGTGDLAWALARQGCQVVGLDFNEAMLEAARRRTARSPDTAQPEFLLGDAQRLPFAADAFDIVTMGYGLRNLASWETGLRELTRVCAPGGRILILDFGKPDNRVWRGAYFAYLRLFVPVLGFLFCGSASAYAYILESLRHYPAQHGVAETMRKLDLTRIAIHNLLGGIMTINYGEKAPGKAPPAGLRAASQ